MKEVAVYTDGSCKKNPGPGGWGAILVYKGMEKELCGGEADTTNNRMELTAVIRALEALREPWQGLGKIVEKTRLEKGGWLRGSESRSVGRAPLAL